MTRNFGVSHRETSEGGVYGKPPGALALTNARDSLPPLPCGSLLEPSEFTESHIHKFQAFESALLSILTGVALFAAVYILLFVET